MSNTGCKFFDMTPFKKTEGIEERCNIGYVTQELKRRFTDVNFTVTRADVNKKGYIQSEANAVERCLPFMARVKGMPEYCDVRIKIFTGKFHLDLFVCSPLTWNKRFLGTCGGGDSTGGKGYIKKPDEYSRGSMMPYALVNGFSTATCDANNVDGFDDRMLNKETNEIEWEYYDNWRKNATHFMAIFGKAVTEILHDERILYSYLNGGSGGGRQCITNVQEFPDDFDGVWASCPAINWARFLPMGYFFPALMNKYNTILSPEKLKFFEKQARNKAGGDEKWAERVEPVEIDAFEFVGQRVGKDTISETDCKIMNEIWAGPHDEDGNRLWYSFRPGGTFWQVGIPVGGFYYTLFRHIPKPFFLSTFYIRWVLKNPKWTGKDITMDEFISIMKKSVEMFPDANSDKADLGEFAKHGKLIIDHGTDDPLIPVDGTIDWYNKVVKEMGQESVNNFLGLFIMPGDSHGNCRGIGGGMTANTGFKMLMDWVENGTKPTEAKQVRVDMKGKPSGYSHIQAVYNK